MVFILEGSTNGIQIKLIRDNQSIATSKVMTVIIVQQVQRNFT